MEINLEKAVSYFYPGIKLLLCPRKYNAAKTLD